MYMYTLYRSLSPGCYTTIEYKHSHGIMHSNAIGEDVWRVTPSICSRPNKSAKARFRGIVSFEVRLKLCDVKWDHGTSPPPTEKAKT